jgi:SAM-dependent methyltransferase
MIFKKKYSKIYNHIYKKKDYIKESNYIIDLLKKNKILKKNILELGLGTGNHAKYLIKKNYHVVGVEKSSSMLKIAKKIPKLKCILGDIRNIRLNKKFDVILSLFHVINYMLTNSDMNSFFRTASIHLEKDGLLVFDTWNDKAIKIGHFSESKFFKINKYNIQKTSYSRTNKNKIITIDFKFIFRKQKKIIKSFFEKHIIKYFSFKEICYFANKNNFKLINNYNMLTFSKPLKNDKNSCFVFRKFN